MILEARNLLEVPLVASSTPPGTRIVAVDAEHVCHIFTRRGEADVLTAEQSFRARDAVAIASRVLAGDPRTATAHASLRILAAAVIALSLDDEWPGADAAEVPL